MVVVTRSGMSLDDIDINQEAVPGSVCSDTRQTYARRRQWYKSKVKGEVDSLQAYADHTQAVEPESSPLITPHDVPKSDSICFDTRNSYAERRRWYKQARTFFSFDAVIDIDDGTPPSHDEPVPGRYQALAKLSFCVITGLATWFCAASVLPEICKEWNISEAQGSLLTIFVNAGFLSGALLSVWLGAADRIPSNRLMSGGCFLAAGLTAVLALPGCGYVMALVMRFAAGAAMSIVYPPACRHVAGC